MAEHAAGRGPAAERHVLELSLSGTQQLFNSMDPAPFRERDLDPTADAYILDWGREAPAHAPLGLVVYLGKEPATPEVAAMVRAAVHDHFQRRAQATWRSLGRLFRDGRISLVIALGFLLLAIVMGEIASSWIKTERNAILLTESLMILGWVALWRPLGIFLYDWWPLRADARLKDRLATMDVQVLDGKARAAGTAGAPAP